MKVAPEIDSMILFVLLVLPGLVSMHVYRWVMPARDIDWKTALVEALFYGTLNFGICLPIIIPIHRNNFPNAHLGWYITLMISVLIVIPFIWPCLLRFAFRWKWLMKKLQLPYPTAWDYFFGKRRCCFVLIHLKNGKMIGGYYGGESYSTSFPRHGDLYLERVCKVDADGCFKSIVDRTDGMLIPSDAYTYVEMFTPVTTEPVQGDNNE